MKTLYRLFSVIAIIAAFASCQREQIIPESRTVHFKLNADMAETRTGITYDAGSYAPYWSNGDQLGILLSIPDSKGDLTNDAVFSNTAATGQTASFEGEITHADGEGITFYSYYPASSGKKVYVSNEGVTTFGLDVPHIQAPAYHATLGYTFDPAADILVAKPASMVVVSNEGANEANLSFARVTSILRLSLNMEDSVTGYGELVKKVTITTSAGDITGRVIVSLEGDCACTGVNNLGTSKELIANVDPNTVPVYVGSDFVGANNVFLSVAPVTIPKASSLTFTIETVNASTKEDAHKIVKTIPSTPADIVFDTRKPTVITLNIIESEVSLADALSGEDYSGEYFITNAGKTAAAVKYSSGNNLSSESITYDGTAHALFFTSGEPEDSKFTITKITEGTYSGMYTIQDAGDKYIYAAGSSNNYMKGQASASVNAYWTITCDNEGNWSLIASQSSNRNVMQYNADAGKFSCYASASQTAVALVPWSELETRTPVTLSFSEASITKTTANYNEFTGQTATASPNVTAVTNNITYAITGDAIGTINASTGAVTLNGTEGSATVTASFAGDVNYCAAERTYSITVVSADVNDGTLQHPYTVAEALAIIAGYNDKQKSAEPVYVSGIVAQVGAYNSTYHSVTYDISDDGATSNMLNIYSGRNVGNTDFSSNSQISVSDEVIVYGYLYLFGSTKEMYQSNYISTLNGTKYLAAGSLAVTTDDANKQITVTWGAALGSSESISYSVACGTQNYVANTAGSHTFTMADYGTYDVIVVASASDANSATASTTATISSGKTYTITFAKGTTFTTNQTTYTGTFDNTCSGLELTLANVNNGGNNNWTEMRAGRNKTASTPTITTKSAIAEAIRTVTLHITQVDTGPITSAKLYVSSSSDFSSKDTYGISISGTGDASATVTSPAANKYYQIEIVTDNTGTANGFLRFDKIIYTTN